MDKLIFDNMDIILELIKISIKEDLGANRLDLTTKFTVEETKRVEKKTASIISKNDSSIIVCGLFLVEKIMELLSNDKFKIIYHVKDGDILNKGEKLITVIAKSEVLAISERIILNFLRHLSAISTLTNKFVRLSGRSKILDTRKTTPGFRYLEKYAVRCGGGYNHRYGLFDEILIKDTHINIYKNLNELLDYACKKSAVIPPIIIEANNYKDVQTILTYKNKINIKRIILDNMSKNDMIFSIKLCLNIVDTEISGNVSLANIRDLSVLGANYISVGAITYDAGNVDLSLEIEKYDTE